MGKICFLGLGGMITEFFIAFTQIIIFNAVPVFTSGFFTAIGKIFYAVGLPARSQT